MYHYNDLSKMDCRGLSLDPMQWEFFDVAPFDAACCGLCCFQGLTAFTFSCVSAWGDVVVHACSGQCVVSRIEHELKKSDALEVAMNAAYTVIPAGDFGSFKVIKPNQISLF